MTDRRRMGEGDPGLPSLLGGSFGPSAGTSSRAGMALVAAVRGVISRRDARVPGGTGPSGGTGGGGGGTIRPNEPTGPIRER